MKAKFVIGFLAAAAMASCSGNKNASAGDSALTASEQTAKDTISLKGQWYIENIVFSDSVYVRPSEQTPDVKQYFTFDDGSFSIQTNCNTIQGEYKISGDSIFFPMTLMTEMACDNMATEDALRKILPDISTIDVQNDSVVRLNGKTPAECILLVKAQEKN